MNKTLGISLTVAVAIITLSLLFRPAPKSVEQVAPSGTVNHAETKSPTVVPTVAESPTASETAVEAPVAVEEKPVEIVEVAAVKHQPADFEKGTLENVVVKDGLMMGDNAAAMSRAESPSIFGIYISPEQRFPESFDSVILSLDAEMRDDTSVSLEFRSKGNEGTWSEWKLVESFALGEPVLTMLPAESLQYRVTLYTQDLKNGPIVRSVSVATRNSRAVPPQSIGSSSGDPAEFIATARP